MSRAMSEPHHHHHAQGHAHAHTEVQALAGPRVSLRIDTLLKSAGSRLLGVALACGFMWAALWLAVRAG